MTGARGYYPITGRTDVTGPVHDLKPDGAPICGAGASERELTIAPLRVDASTPVTCGRCKRKTEAVAREGGPLDQQWRHHCGGIVVPTTRRVKAKVLRPQDKELATVIYLRVKCPTCGQQVEAAGIGDEDAAKDFARALTVKPREFRPARTRRQRKVKR